MIDTESFLDEAIASLRTQLPAAIDALNLSGAYDPPVPKPEPEDYYVGPVRRPLRYPIVEIAVPNWTLTDLDLGQLTADADFTMMASVTLRDVGEAALHSDRLYRWQQRYVRALLNVLLEPNAFGQHATVTGISGAYRQNPQTRESEEVIGAAVVAFTVETTQTREL